MDRQSIIKKLEKANYTGVDIDIDESLFTYGFVTKMFESDIYVIYSLPVNEMDIKMAFELSERDLNENYIFDYTIINLNDLIADTEEAFQDKDFINYLGIDESNQKDILAELKAKNIFTINCIIQDLNNYKGLYQESYFDMPFEKVFR